MNKWDDLGGNTTIFGLTPMCLCIGVVATQIFFGIFTPKIGDS